MSSPIKNVIIAGAGGNLGGPALDAFLASSLNISVLTRPDSKSTFPSSVNVIKTDYTLESLKQALQNQDAVVSFLGTPGLGDAQNALIDAAAATGVKRFIPSEFGHNTGNEKVREVAPFIGKKRTFVEHLQKYDGSGLTWTGVITGLFFDWGFNLGFLGVDAKTGTAKIWDDGKTPFSTTNLRTIGGTIVKLLTDSAAYEDSKNKYIYTASRTTTQAELLAAAEKASGKKYAVTNINGTEAVAEAKQKLANGDLSSIGTLLQSIAFHKFNGESLADFREYGIFNEKYGLKDVPLEEDVKSLVAAL